MPEEVAAKLGAVALQGHQRLHLAVEGLLIIVFGFCGCYWQQGEGKEFLCPKALAYNWRMTSQEARGQVLSIKRGEYNYKS